ncbi:MAG TPA: hemerythrin family protein [Thermohalobaculum sp.]|nr:hemerythrin family protein [Thermohalobaculum sp.]
MAPLEWKDSYSVGVPAVDHEHQELIGLVNQLQRALASQQPEDAVADIFGDLFRAISAHFALEERFMREHGYDQTTQHKADHERLLDELRDIMDDYRDCEDHSGENLIASIEAWFANHFKTHDARLHSRLGEHPH